MKSNFFNFIILVLFGGGIVFSFSSCGDDEVKLPAIGGFNNSDEVAATSLVAYWPLDGNGKESKSGASPSQTLNASFVTGVRGQAVSFTNGLLAYNEIAALNTLPSFTVSAWVNVKNNQDGASVPTCLFNLAKPWHAPNGNINFLIETGRYKSTSDTIVAKIWYISKIGTAENGQDGVNEPSRGGVQAPRSEGKWFHVVGRWSAATNKTAVFVNGVNVTNPEWEDRKFNNGPIGDLTFWTPTNPIIGGWADNTNITTKGSEGWHKPMTGLVDELRVFNKSITDAEISALYQLGLAGR
ncbi:MAG: LamG-like jellyroll fold domain-containing protein [Saprospiraceae bacterium]